MGIKGDAVGWPRTCKTRPMIRHLILAASLLALTGCESLSHHTGSVWNWSERQAVSGWREVVAVLRPAPEPEDRFLARASDTGDAALNAHILQERLYDTLLEPREEPPVVKVAVNRTVDNGVTVIRPGAPMHVRRQVPPSPSYPSPVARPVSPPVAPSVDPYAYVSVTGATDMADWQACERAVGGAFLVGPSGAAIAPDFDACMRGRGYLPESEAARRMQSGVLAGG